MCVDFLALVYCDGYFVCIIPLCVAAMCSGWSGWFECVLVTCACVCILCVSAVVMCHLWSFCRFDVMVFMVS